MGHLNSFSASGGGNLNENFPKIQMPGGLPGGMFKPRFDWYIINTESVLHHDHKEITAVNKQSKVESDAFEWLLHNL